MQTRFRILFPLPPASHVHPAWRAIVLYPAIAVYLVSRLLLIWPDALAGTADSIGWHESVLTAATVLFAAAAALAYVLVRRGQSMSAAATLVLILLAEGTIFLLSDAWNTPRGWIALVAALIISVLLLEKRLTAAAAAAVVLVIGASGLQHSADFSGAEWAGYLAAAAWVLAAPAFIALAQSGWRQAQQTTSQSPALPHITQFSEDIARGLFARTELDTFLEQTVNSIQQRFANVDHAQVYLIQPESSRAMLRAATGPAGERLVEQEYELDVGSLSAVGRVTLTGAPLLIPDYDQDPIRSPHPLLAETRSELAIPLGVEGNIFGALDVQSFQPYSFDEAEVSVLCAHANQIAMAVDSLQLYESAQRSIRENQALYQQTQTNLREIERLNYQLTGRAWSDYLRLQTDTTAITLDMESGHIPDDTGWTPTLEEAVARHQVITTTLDGQRVVALPIVMRNEVVGAMEFEFENDSELPEGALKLVTEVGQRLGLAMENRRLFDETQRIAQREALINDIGADLQAASGVDAILQRTARHLQEALVAQQVTIRLGTPLAEPKATAGPGGAQP